MKTFAIALVFLLAACVNPNNSPEVRSVQRITQGCAAYDVVLRSLAVVRHSMSEESVDAVNQWRPIMNGFCMAEVPDVATDNVLDVMEKALYELNKIDEANK